MQQQQTVIVVDAFSTGKYLALEFIARGYQCIHIQTQRILPTVFSDKHISEQYILNIYADLGIGAIKDILSSYTIKAVLAGTETGVEFADFLSEELGLATNGSNKSSARRNKFHMIEACRTAGLTTVSHCLADTVEEILAWQQQLGSYPVVLKPVKSAAADHVIFCNSTDEIRHAFDKIMNCVNVFDQKNTQVLAQSFLTGTEFIVNTISVAGSHYIAEIWKCHKQRIAGAGTISILEELLPYDNEQHFQLTDYAKKVLDALNIMHGPGHFEIMLTADGPVLIEVAARLQGCMDPLVTKQALCGDSCVSLMVDAVDNPDSLRAKINEPYKLNQYVYRIFIRSSKAGKLSKTPSLAEIKNLPSYASSVMYLKKGEQLSRTTGIANTPGLIHLVNSDKLQLQKDYKHYCDYEKNKLFEVTV